MQTPPQIIPSNAPHVSGSPWLLEEEAPADATQGPQPDPDGDDAA